VRRHLLPAAALAGLLAIAGLMLVPPLLGYERYVIEGGSMGGAVPRGSIAYEEVVPTARIAVGDVITYRPPNSTKALTHRVAWIGHSRDGVRLYRTKGDVNPAPDPWTFTLPNDTQARVAMHVPLAGFAIEALSVRGVRMGAIGGPALLIAIAAFAGVARQRGRALSFG
jgi:signal peptidase I